MVPRHTPRPDDRVPTEVTLVAAPSDPGPARWRRWAAAARRCWAEQREAHERLLIMNRPWTHELAHWVPTEGGDLELHGSVPPPRGSRPPVTTGGWCPCLAAERRRRRIDEVLASAAEEN